MANISVDKTAATAATGAVTAALSAFSTAATAYEAAQDAVEPYHGSPERSALHDARVAVENTTRQLVIVTGTLNDLIVAAIG